MKYWQILLTGILIGLLASGAILLISGPTAKVPLSIVHPTQLGSLLVDVDGAVASPGVYSLPSGSRVNDAIQQAGGLMPDADTSGINLAGELRDGEKITIPSIIVPTTGISNFDSSNSLINLNTATLEELDQLPGIGPQKAAAIIDYREAYGEFQSLEDLLYVPGIGKSLLDTIRNYVTVEP